MAETHSFKSNDIAGLVKSFEVVAPLVHDRLNGIDTTHQMHMLLSCIEFEGHGHYSPTLIGSELNPHAAMCFSFNSTILGATQLLWWKDMFSNQYYLDIEVLADYEITEYPEQDLYEGGDL